MPSCVLIVVACLIISVLNHWPRYGSAAHASPRLRAHWPSFTPFTCCPSRAANCWPVAAPALGWALTTAWWVHLASPGYSSSIIQQPSQMTSHKLSIIISDPMSHYWPIQASSAIAIVTSECCRAAALFPWIDPWLFAIHPERVVWRALTRSPGAPAETEEASACIVIFAFH